MSNISHLECAICGEKLDPSRPRVACPGDGGMLMARYNLDVLRQRKQRLEGDRPNSMWRYSELLPAASLPVSLGEGWTPLLKSHTNPRLWIKNEGANPTGSYEDRGLSVAVSALRNYGVQKLAIASAGDSAATLAAYCARAGLKASCFVSQEAPLANRAACSSYGAETMFVDGTIEDCERVMRKATASQDFFAISDGCEPLQLEGEKTLGFEIVEQLGWRVPDVIVIPTGSGSAVVAIWKALQEMQVLGWVNEKRPRLIAVQAGGCAPIARAFTEDEADCKPWTNPRTIASELCIPNPRAGSLALKAVRESGGLAITVSDEEMIAACLQLASSEGVFAAPEGGAALCAHSKLRATGLLRDEDEVVIVSTRTGLKCPEVFQTPARDARKPLPKSHSLGGIIQPY